MTRHTKRTPYLTATLIALCWGASLALWTGESVAVNAAQSWRSLPRRELFHDPFWLYVGWSVVLHSNWPHLILNTGSLAVCGAALESGWSQIRFALMVMVSGFLASTAQAAWLGHGDIGVSGVVYACVGALAVSQYFDEDFRTRTLHLATAAILVWLVIGIVREALGTGNIGNISHLTGLGIGVMFAAGNRGLGNAQIDPIHAPGHSGE